MSLLQFFDKWPWLAALTIVCCAGIIGSFINWAWLVINRAIRASVLKKIGWPPRHLDADGDFHSTS